MSPGYLMLHFELLLWKENKPVNFVQFVMFEYEYDFWQSSEMSATTLHQVSYMFVCTETMHCFSLLLCTQEVVMLSFVEALGG